MATNVWWRCAQYFVITFCGLCLETIDVYMAHVCFYYCYSDCVGVCGNVYCVAVVVEVFLELDC